MHACIRPFVQASAAAAVAVLRAVVLGGQHGALHLAGGGARLGAVQVLGAPIKQLLGEVAALPLRAPHRLRSALLPLLPLRRLLLRFLRIV